MKKLQKYAKASSLMDITIVLDNGEKFKFNLYRELEISEERLNFEAMEQPSSYAFLSTLYQKLIKVVDDRKLEASKAWAKYYIAVKADINPNTGRNYADDLAKAMADDSDEYAEAMEAYSTAKYKAGLLQTCVSSFESRANLIQTISANNRKH
jgi:hypothetical protein